MVTGSGNLGPGQPNIRLTFSPPTAPQGARVRIRVSSPPSLADRWEIWGYTTPNTRPTSELGWHRIGEVRGQGGSLEWDTRLWSPGQLTLTTVGYVGGEVVFHWRNNSGFLFYFYLTDNEGRPKRPSARIPGRL